MSATAHAPLVKTPLWDHQIDALDAMRAQPAFLLAHDMGAGKSLTAIAALEQRQAMRVIVLCPKSVVAVWPDQLAQHATRTWHTWAGTVMGTRGPLANPSVPKRCEALIQANTDAIKLGRPFMAVVNYEASHVGQMANLLVGTDWDAVILDESHRIKSPSGKASKLAARVTHKTRGAGGLILALTGTPMPHSPPDIWAQVRALDGGERFGTNYHHFCQKYIEPKEIHAKGGVLRTVYTGGDVLPVRREQFAGHLRTLMHRVESEDVLDLPTQEDIYRTFTLGPKARRVYDELERDLIADIDGGVVTAANAMVLVTRLAQATSGFATNHDTGDAEILDDPTAKGALLVDLLGDIPNGGTTIVNGRMETMPVEPVVVFCRFHADLDAVRDAADKTGRTYGELSGRRRDGLDGPRLAEGVTLLGCQIKSGGTGIDLTAARFGIYYSLGFELADYEQSRKRIHRPGQTRPVIYTHLLAENTIDRAVYGALRQRRDVVEAVIQTVKEQQA